MDYVPVHGVPEDPSVAPSTPHHIGFPWQMRKSLSGAELLCLLLFLSAWHAVDIQGYAGLTPEALGGGGFWFCF